VELDTTRAKEGANAVETGLAIHVEPVVCGEIEGAKRFPSLPRTLLKIFVEHLFPALRVEAGGVRYHAVEIKEDGVVLFAADAPAVLPHGLPPVYQRTSSLSCTPPEPLVCPQQLTEVAATELDRSHTVQAPGQ
jgi:hypothetical protein